MWFWRVGVRDNNREVGVVGDWYRFSIHHTHRNIFRVERGSWCREYERERATHSSRSRFAPAPRRYLQPVFLLPRLSRAPRPPPPPFPLAPWGLLSVSFSYFFPPPTSPQRALALSLSYSYSRSMCGPF